MQYKITGNLTEPDKVFWGEQFAHENGGKLGEKDLQSLVNEVTNSFLGFTPLLARFGVNQIDVVNFTNSLLRLRYLFECLEMQEVEQVKKDAKFRLVIDLNEATFDEIFFESDLNFDTLSDSLKTLGDDLVNDFSEFMETLEGDYVPQSVLSDVLRNLRVTRLFLSLCQIQKI